MWTFGDFDFDFDFGKSFLENQHVSVTEANETCLLPLDPMLAVLPLLCALVDTAIVGFAFCYDSCL